jgi:hypothetical protein
VLPIAWDIASSKDNERNEDLPLIVLELIEHAVKSGEGIVGFGFVSPADVGILAVGNGASEFPIALVAPGFQALPVDASSGQA